MLRRRLRIVGVVFRRGYQELIDVVVVVCLVVVGCVVVVGLRVGGYEDLVRVVMLGGIVILL
jgi:hypothetical protein